MKELIIPMGKVQIMGFILGVLLVAILILPFWAAFGTNALQEVLQFFKYTVFIPSLLLGIIAHEAIHGFTWAWSSRLGINKIKFGFQLKTFTPYAHCTAPMSVKAYRIGTLMPLVILGIAPYLAGLFFRMPIIFGFGVFFSFVAVGDIIILWLVRDLKENQMVQDHPTAAGVILYDKNEI